MSNSSLTPPTPLITPAAPLHPFYPLSILLPSYKPNTLHPIALLILFFVPLSAWVYFALNLARKRTASRGKSLAKGELGWIAWFAASGLIHITFEGYFATFHSYMAGSNYVEAQMWKMYSLSDSRYIMSDTFTVLMEGCTAVFWGPMCLYLAFQGIPGSSPFRHPVQLMVSLGQFYGLVLYYAIPIMDEAIGGPTVAVSRPEWICFWGMFVGLNAPWGFVPFYAMWSSVKAIVRAFTILAQIEDSPSSKMTSQVATSDPEEGIPFMVRTNNY